ncbi:hypothetical protein D3C72_2449530 [compost metagenome]
MACAVQLPVFDDGPAGAVAVDGLAVVLSLGRLSFGRQGLGVLRAPGLERRVDDGNAVADMHGAVGIAMKDDGGRHGVGRG